jgi:poly(A) polymerase
MVREIWRLQLRLERRVSRRVERLTQEIKFRAAYDFLLLRAKVEPAMEEVATWWQAYVEGDARTRRGLLQGLNKTTAKKRKAKSVASPAYFPPTDQIE